MCLVEVAVYNNVSSSVIRLQICGVVALSQCDIIAVENVQCSFSSVNMLSVVTTNHYRIETT